MSCLDSLAPFAQSSPLSPPDDLHNRSLSNSPERDEQGHGRKRTANGSSLPEKRSANKICRVCGDKAFSYNFNVITCESCKAFFRRNANKEKEIRCPFNEQCEINVVSRRFCQRCRLFKCFSVGMKKEWIMTDEARHEKKQRVEENRERRKEESRRKDSESVAPSLPPPAPRPPLPLHNAVIHNQQPTAPAPSVSSIANDILDALAAQPSAVSSSLPFVPPSTGVFSPLSVPLPPPTPLATSSFPPQVTVDFSNVFVDFKQQTVASILNEQMVNTINNINNMALAPHSAPLSSLPPSLPLQDSPFTPSSFLPPSTILSFDNPPSVSSLMGFAPPASALAAVASVAQPPPTPLSAPAPFLPPRPDKCSCNCACGKYDGPRSIVEQAREEWEAEQERRHSGSRLSLEGESTISWLNGAPVAPFADAPTTITPIGTTTKNVTLLPSEENYTRIRGIKEQYLANPLNTHKEAYAISDPEFGPVQMEDQILLDELKFANALVWDTELDKQQDNLHKSASANPSNQQVVNLMAGAVKRLIIMAKKLAFWRSQMTDGDRIKLIKANHVDYLIIRGAMAYDPEKNSWKGPSSSSNYDIKMDSMDDGNTRMYQQTLQLYTQLKEDFRSNQEFMLLLGIIILYDTDRVAAELGDKTKILEHQNKYKRILKRKMWQKHERSPIAAFEYQRIVDLMGTVRKMNRGAMDVVGDCEKTDPLLRELLDLPPLSSSSPSSADKSPVKSEQS